MEASGDAAPRKRKSVKLKDHQRKTVSLTTDGDVVVEERKKKKKTKKTKPVAAAATHDATPDTALPAPVPASDADGAGATVETPATADDRIEEGGGKTFAELGLHEALCDACDALGWKAPTPIQAAAIPKVMPTRLPVSPSPRSPPAPPTAALAFRLGHACRAKTHNSPLSSALRISISPSPLPQSLTGKDIIGLAETGSGKVRVISPVSPAPPFPQWVNAPSPRLPVAGIHLHLFPPFLIAHKNGSVLAPLCPVHIPIWAGHPAPTRTHPHRPVPPRPAPPVNFYVTIATPTALSRRRVVCIWVSARTRGGALGCSARALYRPTHA